MWPPQLWCSHGSGRQSPCNWSHLRMIAFHSQGPGPPCGFRKGPIAEITRLIFLPSQLEIALPGSRHLPESVWLTCSSPRGDLLKEAGSAEDTIAFGFLENRSRNHFEGSSVFIATCLSACPVHCNKGSNTLKSREFWLSFWELLKRKYLKHLNLRPVFVLCFKLRASKFSWLLRTLNLTESRLYTFAKFCFLMLTWYWLEALVVKGQNNNNCDNSKKKKQNRGGWNEGTVWQTEKPESRLNSIGDSMWCFKSTESRTRQLLQRLALSYAAHT